MRQGRRNGCFQVFKVAWTITFFVILIILTEINVFFSNIFGETCGFIHPYIFEVEVSVIDTEGLMISSRESIPFASNEEVVLFQDAGLLVSAAGGVLDTYLRIYDANGEILLAEDDDFEDSYTSGIQSFSLDENTEIIIEIATYIDSFEGIYNLSIQDVGEASEVTAEALAPDDYFDVIIDAGTINPGESIEGDIYMFERIRYTSTVEAGRAYDIFLDGTAGFLDNERSANSWGGCLQYYGFLDNDGYTINSNGYYWFVPQSLANKAGEICAGGDDTFRAFLEECVNATINISPLGRIIFFVLLAIIVVSLPILIVDSLEGQRETLWYLFLLLVVVQATTTAMLFLHLGSVSGIEALSEFGYGIFGGITTGSALVFIDKLAHRAEDGTPMMFPSEDER